MIKLRSNQETPIRKAVEFFSMPADKPSLIVLPTAWGKSILTAYVARECQDRLLVVQPSKELLEQNIQKYYDLCGGLDEYASIFSASCKSKEIGQITYATIGSIKSLGKEFRGMGFTKMLIDEAHLYPRSSDSMLGRFLEDSGIRHVLGVTATPVKLQQNRDLDGNVYSKLVMLTSRSKYGTLFKQILHVGQVREMVELGFWAPLKYETVKFDARKLKFNSSRSEYTEESVYTSYQQNGGARAVMDALNRHPERRHVLVFCPAVDEAMQMSSFYKGSAVIYGEMPQQQRDDIIRRFRWGEIRVLFNVRVLTTGFDYTGIDCIILAMSTASVALYYQIVGRATRIDPEKEDALIIDLGGNCKRFGRVEDITYEKGRTGIWKMYGTGGVQLSGVPIHEIGMVRKDSPVQLSLLDALNYVMPFGKYMGERMETIPVEYKRWMLRNFTWDSRNERMYHAIKMTM